MGVKGHTSLDGEHLEAGLILALVDTLEMSRAFLCGLVSPTSVPQIWVLLFFVIGSIELTGLARVKVVFWTGMEA